MPGWMKGAAVCHTNERVGAKVEAVAGRTEGGLVDRIRWRENEGTSGERERLPLQTGRK